jgi:hypothetical protein
MNRGESLEIMDTEEENELLNLSIEVLYEESVQTTQNYEGMGGRFFDFRI